MTILMDTRIRVATAVLAACLSILGGAHAASAAAVPHAETRYACDFRQQLVVTRTADGARVNFIDRAYELSRARSSIGEKFLSATAALIIDGSSAVFVTEDRLQLGACVEATHVAAK